MNKTFQSFVFGCRVNEAERIKIDRELAQAGYTVDLATPSFLIINTCAITGKAEREARQLISQLQKKYPQARIFVTGCSATMWSKFGAQLPLGVVYISNEQKDQLVSHLQTSEVCRGEVKAEKPLIVSDKFRYSNRLLVKIQDGCHRFCSYCIVPYLRGVPQSQSIQSIIAYINSYRPVPSEVVLSAINTESFGKDTGETVVDLIKAVLQKTEVPRIAFGSIHPWSLTEEFINYYRDELSTNPRFMHFFHVPIQSGSQEVLKLMRREYDIQDVLRKLQVVQKIQPNALIATDVIVGFLGETDELFEETYEFLDKSTISRFHVFRFSNRPHTAAFYMKKQADSMSLRAKRSNPIEIATSPVASRNNIVYFEPTAEEKRVRSHRLIELSHKKYIAFLETQIGRESDALVIAHQKGGVRVLLDNHIEGYLAGKHCLPGQLVHVTIMAAKESYVICKES